MQTYFYFSACDGQVGTPPHNGSDTSRAAAARVAPKADTLQHRVLELIRDAGDRGLTNDEIDAITHWGSGTICPRVNELARAGLIRDSGQRRKTRKGSPAKVWVATETTTRVQEVIQ